MLNVKNILTICIISIVLLGCSSKNINRYILNTKNNQYYDKNLLVSFKCTNGMRPTITYLDQEKIRIFVNKEYQILNLQESSASELNYATNTGLFETGAEWYQQGNQAYFSIRDSQGNLAETTCTKQNKE